MKELNIGSILDFTRGGDDSPYIGIVVFDDDLERKVLYEQNGSFSYMEELESKSFNVVDDLDSFLEELKIKYPDDYDYTVKFIDDKVLFIKKETQ